MRRFPSGSYPNKGISEARTLHTRVKQHGADPVAERRRERAMAAAAKQGVGTLGALLDLYGEKRGSSQRAWADSRKRIDLVFRSLLAKPVASLEASDFQILVDAYPSESTGGFVVRSVRPALKWAAQRGYAADGLAKIHPPAPVKRRKHILSCDELTRVLPALRASRRSYGAALLFMLLTLSRRQETALARCQSGGGGPGRSARPRMASRMLCRCPG
jgi:hypothetical protein